MEFCVVFLDRTVEGFTGVFFVILPSFAYLENLSAQMELFGSSVCHRLLKCTFVEI